MTLDMRNAQLVAEDHPRPHPLRWCWLVGALVGVTAAGAAGTAPNLALPALASDLALSSWELRWVAGVTAAGFAVLVVPAAVLGDWFGHVRLFLLGAVGFTLASVLGAVATTGGILTAARLLQGLAAAIMVPQVIGYARRHLPRVERAVACGLFGLAFVAGPVVGPFIGVQLIERTGWQSVFWMVVPAGAAAAAAALPLVLQKVEWYVDPWALAIGAAAIPATGAIAFVLTAWDVSDWPVWYVAPLVLGGLLLAGCAVVEAVRRGAWTGFGAPLVALLATAGAAHLSAPYLYAQLAGGWSAATIATAGLTAAGGALAGAAIAAVLAVPGYGRIAAAAGAGVIGVGAAVQLVLLNGGSLNLGMLAIAAGFVGLGLAMVVVGVLSGGRTAATPALAFAGLALGPMAGGAMVGRLTTNALSSVTTPGQFGALHDATRAVLVWSIGLLAAAAVVAALMAVVAAVTRTRRS